MTHGPKKCKQQEQGAVKGTFRAPGKFNTSDKMHEETSISKQESCEMIDVML